MGTPDIDSIFSGMATAEIHGRGNWMGAGLYVVETKNIFVKKGTNPKKPGDSFIVEFLVLESNNPAHAVGTSGTWVLKFTWPATFGHITKFVLALLGHDPSVKANIDNPKLRELAALYTRATCGSEVAQKALGVEYEKDMFVGIPLKLECSVQLATEAGKSDFTSFSWAPASEAGTQAA